ncbi:MAG: lytic murein transglycosylase [bacterium]|nr:lytic murein transglycosylase [bacterium]
MSKNTEKPKIVSDILPRGVSSVFRKIGDPLGRRAASFKEISKKLRTAIIISLTMAVFFVFSNAHFSILAPTALSQSTDVERKNLETELENLEQEIDGYEKTIMGLQNQTKTLNQSLKLLDAEINKLNLQIKATDIQLQRLDKGILSLKQNITFTEGDIGRIKLLLGESLQQIDKDDQETILELILRNEKLSDFFNNINALTVLQNEMRENLNKLVEMKTNLITQKDTLSVERQDVLSLKAIQQNQKMQLNEKLKEKKSLIAATKGQESKYQDLLKKSKQTAAQIKSRIFELLGGGELTFGEAYKLAQFASEQTGVRAALILSVLDRESSLGQNVGRCNWKTAMHPTRDQQIFLDLTSELGIDPNSVSVSCANSDGAYGGAMGPAQFIPSTWACYGGYVDSVSGTCTSKGGTWSYNSSKDRIGAITGNKPSSPWKNTDAFVATALYLKDVGAAAQTYAAERKAAAMYYAGSRWKTYLYSYGQWVVERARSFEEDIKDLLG